EGGDLLRAKALAAATALPSLHGITTDDTGQLVDPDQLNLVRAFSARHEFPDAWNAFLRPAPTEVGQTLALDLAADRFPQQLRGRALTITGWAAVLKLAEPATGWPSDGLPVQVTVPGATPPNPP